MYRYWAKIEEGSDLSVLQERYSTEEDLMSAAEVKAVHSKLEDNFYPFVQEALDRIYNVCVGPSKQSAENF